MKQRSIGSQSHLSDRDASLWRPLVSHLLWRAGLALAHLARRLRIGRMGHSKPRLAELEFYAEAGAPEGALYLDGEYIGRLPGVTRL